MRIDLLRQGKGSGFDPSRFVRSDGSDLFVMDNVPTTADVVNIPIQANDIIPPYSFITINGHLADSANPAHFGRVAGIVPDGALIGFIADTVVFGTVINGGWSWTIGDKLFLNGIAISTTPVTTGFSQMLALAVQPSFIFVNLRQPIKL